MSDHSLTILISNPIKEMINLTFINLIVQNGGKVPAINAAKSKYNKPFPMTNSKRI